MNGKDARSDVVKMLENINLYTIKTVQIMQEKTVTKEQIVERVNSMGTLLSKLQTVITKEVYRAYDEFFQNAIALTDHCRSTDFLTSNYDTLVATLSLVSECLVSIVEVYESRVKTDEQMIAYLKQANLQKAPEHLRVLQITPSQYFWVWMQTRCPHLKYETVDDQIEEATYKTDVYHMQMLPSEAFDVILCQGLLDYANQDKQIVAELKRILKQDGQILFAAPADLNIEFIDEEYVGEYFYIQPGAVGESVVYILSKLPDISLDFEVELEIDEELLVNGPKVSVLLPCYNHGEFVAEAIESVINQTYKNIEFIVADDGSPDNSAEVMKRYEQYYDKSLYFEENKGSRFAEMREYATGKYIALMHSDDVWHPDKLALQITYLEKHPECGVCLSWSDYTDEFLNPEDDYSIFYQGNRTSTEWIRFFWDKGNALCNPSSVMKREYRMVDSKYGRDCWQLPDLFWWVDVAQKTQMHIIPKALVKMRRYQKQNKANMSEVTQETSLRHMVEAGTHWLPFLRDMDNDFFCKAFADLLRKKDASTDEEVKCEKYFLMLSSDNPMIQANAFTYLAEIFNEVSACLSDTYHYWKKDIKKDTITYGFGAIYKKLLGDE